MNTEAKNHRAVIRCHYCAVFTMWLALLIALCVEPCGAQADIFVTNVGNGTVGSGTIGEYALSGAKVKSALITGLSGPQGIAISGSYLFVANYLTNTIGEYTLTGDTVNAALITGLNGLNGPRGIAVSGSDVFVANYSNGTIGKYTVDSASGTLMSANASFISGLGTDGPVDVAVVGSDLFVTNQETYVIGKYDTATGASALPMNSSLVAGLREPFGIATSGSTLFIGSGVDTDQNTIGEYTTTGTPVAGKVPLLAGLHDPSLFAVYGPNIFVVDSAGTIGKYPLSGASGNASFIKGLGGPWGIAISNPTLVVQQPAGTPLISGASTVAFDPASLAIRDQLTFTIVNGGTANLTNLALSISGENAGEFHAGAPHATTLAPGASTTFTVSFAPSVGGAASATLHVKSNDAQTPSFDVSLTGAGVSYAPQQGTFVSLLGGSDFVTIKVGSSGKFTGKLILGGISYPLVGGLSGNGDWSGSIGHAPIAVTLHLDPNSISATAGGYSLTGSVGGTAFTTYHTAYASGAAVPEKPKYTVLLKPIGSGQDTPQGIGYAISTVGKGGAVRFVGKLADNTVWSAAGLLVGDGHGHDQFVLYDTAIYGGKGRVSGAVIFESLTYSDCNSTLTWIKPKPATGSYYANGIATSLKLVGAQYRVSSDKPAPPFVAGAGNAALSDTTFSHALGETLSVSPFNLVTVTSAPDAEKLSITLSEATGSFKGSFMYPGTQKVTTFSGVLYQNTNAPQGGGFYLSPLVSGAGYSGSVILTP